MGGSGGLLFEGFWSCIWVFFWGGMCYNWEKGI